MCFVLLNDKNYVKKWRVKRQICFIQPPKEKEDEVDESREKEKPNKKTMRHVLVVLVELTHHGGDCNCRMPLIKQLVKIVITCML